MPHKARILVGCEFSGIVRSAFYALGHDAWSCDLLEAEDGGPHLQCDVLSVLNDKWDLFIGHPPCFPADTLITTKRGLVPIQDVVVGDEVLTHRSRWKKVVARGKRKFPVLVTLKGKGACGLTMTPEHPVWTKQRQQNHRKTNGSLYKWTDPSWLAAGDCVGRYWATPLSVPRQKVEFPFGFSRSNPDFWYMVGRGVGDGWCRNERWKQSVMICCGRTEMSYLEGRLKRVAVLFNNEFMKNRERTTYRFSLHDKPLAIWLTKNFNSGADKKEVPVWLLGMSREIKEAFLEGYLDSDGDSVAHIGVSGATTVSKKLAIGIKLLAEGLGRRTAVYREKPRKKPARIEGRLLNNVIPPYVLRWRDDPQEDRIQAYKFGDHAWSKIKNISVKSGNFTVHNITVEGDQSYVADGIVVHNCTFLTNAGVRWLYKNGKGIERDPERWRNMEVAAYFFRKLLDAPIPRVCIENPIMHRYSRALIGAMPSCLIHPWQFGHAETKGTALYLKNLPRLKPTDIIKPDLQKYPPGRGNGFEPRVHHASPGPERWKERSRTLPGVARALAEQYGALL